MNTTKLAVIALIIIVITPIGLGYLMNVEETQDSSFEVVKVTNVTNSLLNSTSPYSLERVGSYMDNAFLATYYADPDYYAGETDNYTQIPKPENTYGSLALTTGTWVDVFDAAGYNANSVYLRLVAQNAAANEALGQIRVITLAGDTATYNITSPTASGNYAFLYFKLGTLVFQDANAAAGFTVVSNVSGIEINTPYNNVRPTRGDIFGDEYDKYYDYTKGWQKASASIDTFWANGMDNSLVEIISDVPLLNSPAKIEAFDTNNNGSGVISYWFDATPGNYGTFVQVGTADPVLLGNYHMIRIVVELDKVTFYGLPGDHTWPSMGMAYLISYNSVEVPYASAINSIHYIELMAGSNPILRVDRTQSLAGSFPVIKNTTLTPSSLYPDMTSYGVQLNHVDMAGTSIVFGSNTYTVTNKTITVNNKTIDLEGSVWRSVYNGDEYVNTINGTVVSTSSNPITMGFNGSWSTIVELQHMDVVTWTHTEWVPGKFAWDGIDANFCIVGLIASAGAFVGLGMYGARSGAKVGKLMLVCGAMAFVFIALM